jgi:acyl-CoA reductase-like NAD-dependent aldehyde dehydrogenase
MNVSEVKEYQYFAGGQWRSAESKKLFDVFRPYDRSVYARVPAGGRAEAKLAVEAAAKAFPAWSQTTPAERSRLFFKAAEIVRRRRTEYGLTSSILAGNTYRAFELAPKILAGIVNVNSPTVNDEIHAPMGGVRDSGWGRTGPDSLKEFQDLIWINSHSGQRQYPI